MATAAEEMVVDLFPETQEARQPSVDVDISETPAKPEKPEKVAKPDKTERRTIEPEEGIEILKANLKKANDEREAAEARAREAESRATAASQGEAEARGQVQNSQLEQVKSAISQLTQHSDQLEGQLETAYAAGDFKSVAKIQRTLADNSAKLQTLENGKVSLEKAPKPVPRVTRNKVEEFAANMAPQSAAWIRAHPDFVLDDNKNKQMIAAHELALARNLTPETPQYFADIEKTLAITPAVTHTDDDETDLETMSSASTPTTKSPPVAPVTRASNGRGNTVRLTAEEVEMAQMCGQTPEEYARNKMALKKEGRLS